MDEPSSIMLAEKAQSHSSNYRTFRVIISDNGYGTADKLYAEGRQVLREYITTKMECRTMLVKLDRR